MSGVFRFFEGDNLLCAVLVNTASLMSDFSYIYVNGNASESIKIEVYAKMV